MDELISRQAAIDALNREIIKRRLLDDVNDGMLDEFDTEDILRKLPPAQTEPRWIPVEERLPEANGRYLVTRGLNACGAIWNRVYLINYSDLMGLKSERIWWNGNVGKSDFERIDDVIAWMPLPQPYERSEE